jgi:hypothetical protein
MAAVENGAAEAGHGVAIHEDPIAQHDGLAGSFVHSAAIRPALISRFSSSVLRCFGAATIEASMI